MANIVSVYAHKGGHGKSSIASSYARFSDSHYFTNDYRGGAEKLFKGIVGEDKFHIIYENDKGLEIFPKSVFDFGGFQDSKVGKILKESDLIVIPLCYQSRLDLEAFYNTLDSVAEVNEKILIVINNTAKKFLDSGLAEAIGQETKNKYPVKVIKQSAFMTYLVDEGVSPLELQVVGATKKALESFQESLLDVFNYIRKA